MFLDLSLSNSNQQSFKGASELITVICQNMRVACLFVVSFCCFSSPLLAQTDEDRWEETKLGVASASAGGSWLTFHRAIVLFETSDPRTIRSFGLNLVEGNADSPIEGSESIHIKGDLNSDVHLSANSELIVAGDVHAMSNIYIEGLSAIFVNGSFFGKIHATETFRLYVNGDYQGTINLKGSSAMLEVHGGFTGNIETSSEGGVLNSATIVVDGFTERGVIDAIYENEFLNLTGVFTISDVAPGIYLEGLPGRKYYTVREQQN